MAESPEYSASGSFGSAQVAAPKEFLPSPAYGARVEEILERQEVEEAHEVVAALESDLKAAGKDPKEALKYLAEHPDFWGRCQLGAQNSTAEISVALVAFVSSNLPKAAVVENTTMSAIAEIVPDQAKSEEWAAAERLEAAKRLLDDKARDAARVNAEADGAAQIAADRARAAAKVNAEADAETQKATKAIQEAAHKIEDGSVSCDKILLRLAELNPAAAQKANGEYSKYEEKARAENEARAARGEKPAEPLSRQDYLTGWFVSNQEEVLSGIKDEKDLKEAKEAITNLDASNHDAVARFVKEVGGVGGKDAAKNSTKAQEALAGIAPDAPSRKEHREKPRAHDVTITQGEGGRYMEVSEGLGDDDYVAVFEKDGTPVSRMLAGEAARNKVGRMGYEVSNMGKDAAMIERENRAAKRWQDLLDSRGLGFLTGGLMSQMERAIAEDPDLQKPANTRIAFTQEPKFADPASIPTVLSVMESAMGFRHGELFNYSRNCALRGDLQTREANRLPADVTQALRIRMQESGLLVAGKAFNLERLRAKVSETRKAESAAQGNKSDRAPEKAGGAGKVSAETRAKISSLLPKFGDKVPDAAPRAKGVELAVPEIEGLRNSTRNRVASALPKRGLEVSHAF